MKETLKKHGLFIIFFLGILALFSFLILKQESILKDGDIVILKTRPVDPRDLLRGEYVILRYEIENNDLINNFIDKNSSDERNQSERDIFVKLRQENGVHIVDSLSNVIGTGEDEIWIKGVLKEGSRQIRYPSIEQYYVPEGLGLPIERLGAGIHVQVAVDNGEMRIVKLFSKDFQEIKPEDYL